MWRALGPVKRADGLQTGLLFVFMLRILFAQAYYIVTYALGIYLLSASQRFTQSWP
jgi:hypothetical protein